MYAKSEKVVPLTVAKGDLPPYSMEAEEALLSCIMLYPGAIDKALELGICANDFFLPQHPYIFRAAVALKESGKEIDMMALLVELEDRGTISQAGGQATLRKLHEDRASIDIKSYCKTVKDKSAKRKTIELLNQKIEQLHRAGTTSAKDLIEGIEADLRAIAPESEGDGDEVRQELEELNSHREPSPASLKMICGDHLYTAIDALAKNLERPTVELVLHALTVASAQLPPSVKIQLPNYSEAIALWRAVVGLSGSRKSSEIKTFLAPLRVIEKEKRAEHAKKKADYEAALAEWEENPEKSPKNKPKYPDNLAPRSPKLIFNDANTEGIIAQLSSQPFQAIAYRDELIGIPNSFNALRGGNGSDREFYMSAYEGESHSKTRAGEDSCFELDAVPLSMIGGICPSKLQEALKGKKGSGDGFWERVVLTSKALPTEIRNGGVKIEIFDILKSVYENLQSSPANDCYLDPQAIALHDRWGTALLQRASLEPEKSYKIIPNNRKNRNFVTFESEATQGKESRDYNPSVTSSNFGVTFPEKTEQEKITSTTELPKNPEAKKKLHQSYTKLKKG